MSGGSDKPDGSGNKKKPAKKKTKTSVDDAERMRRRGERVKLETRLKTIGGEGLQTNQETNHGYLYYRWAFMDKKNTLDAGGTKTQKVRRTPRVTRFLAHMARHHDGHFFAGESEQSIDIESDPAKHAWLRPVKIPVQNHPGTDRGIRDKQAYQRNRQLKKLKEMTSGEDPNRMLYYRYRDHATSTEVFKIPYSEARLKQLQDWSSQGNRIKVWTRGDPGLLGEIWITDESEDEGDINYEGNLVGLKTDQMAGKAVNLPLTTQGHRYSKSSKTLSQPGSSKESPSTDNSQPTFSSWATHPSTSTQSGDHTYAAVPPVGPWNDTDDQNSSDPVKFYQPGPSLTHHELPAGPSTASASSFSKHESDEVGKRKTFLENQKQILESELAKLRADLKSGKKGKRRAKRQKLSSPALTSPETILESPVRPIDLPPPTETHRYSTRSITLSEPGSSKESPVKFYQPDLIGPSNEQSTQLIDPWIEYYQGNATDLQFPDFNFNDISSFGSNQDISGETSTAQTEDNQQIMLEILRGFNEDQRHYENTFANDYSQPTTTSWATHPSTSTQSGDHTYASVPPVGPWNETDDLGSSDSSEDEDPIIEPDIKYEYEIFNWIRDHPGSGHSLIRLSPESQLRYDLSEFVTKRDYYARRAQLIRQRDENMRREYLAQLAAQQAELSRAVPSGSRASRPGSSRHSRKKKRK